MRFRREISEGGLYPGFWYGVAWDEWRPAQSEVVVVCYPIPLNVVIGLLHALYFRFRSGMPLRAWRASYICRMCHKSHTDEVMDVLRNAKVYRP
jgi:hypothetical protein